MFGYLLKILKFRLIESLIIYSVRYTRVAWKPMDCLLIVLESSFPLLSGWIASRIVEAGFISRFENANAQRRSATEQPLLAIPLLNIVEN